AFEKRAHGNLFEAKNPDVLKRHRLWVLGTRMNREFLVIGDLINVVGDTQPLGRDGTGEACREYSVDPFQKRRDFFPGKRFLFPRNPKPGISTESLFEGGERIPGFEEIFGTV